MDPASGYANNRWRTFLAGAFGYELAHSEKVRRSTPPVLSVTLRSVAHYMDAWNWDIKSMDSFCRYFSPLHIDAEESYPGQLEERLPDTQFLFYTVPYSTTADFDKVQNWLKQGQRTLITHSYIPYSINPGFDPLLDSSRFDEVFLPDNIKSVLKAEKTDSVIYRGENYSYADFLKRKVDIVPTARRLAAEFNSLQTPKSGVSGTILWRDVVLENNFESEQYWEWTPAGGKIIATIGNRPLVTILDRPDGSRIIYCHLRLHHLPETLRQELTSRIATEIKLPRLALPVEKRPALAHVYKFNSNKATAVALWDRAALEKNGYYAGYRTKEEWAKMRRFTYRNPGANGAVRLVQPAGKYRILALPSGREFTAQSDGEGILLALDNQLCELFFVAEDTVDWQAKMAAIRARFNTISAELGGE